MLRYAGPVISGVSPPRNAGGRSGDGGFVLTVSGSNFYPGHTYVSITRSLSCSVTTSAECRNVMVDGYECNHVLRSPMVA
jgi:hypothetical protein